MLILYATTTKDVYPVYHDAKLYESDSEKIWQKRSASVQKEKETVRLRGYVECERKNQRQKECKKERKTECIPMVLHRIVIHSSFSDCARSVRKVEKKEGGNKDLQFTSYNRRM